MADKKIPDEEKNELLKYILQFMNLEKRYPLFPGSGNSRANALFMGLDEELYLKFLHEFDEQARKAALELLKEDNVTKQLAALPFQKGDTVLVLGDSVTDDRQGWFEILTHVLEIAVPSKKIGFKNAAVAGSTSFHALDRLDTDVLAHEPEWVIIALGTNDSVRKNYAANRTLVSITEFWENINTIEQAVKDVTDNPIIWMTPPPVIKEMMDENPVINGFIDEKDLNQYREVISGKSGFIIDPTGARMGRPPQAWNYLSDGFHLSLAGHLNTVRSLMKGLTTSHETHPDHHHDHDHHDES